jgi:hypothetical protein
VEFNNRQTQNSGNCSVSSAPMRNRAGNSQPANSKHNKVMPGTDTIDKARLTVEKARRSFRFQADDSATGAAMGSPGSVMSLLYTAAVGSGQQVESGRAT